MNYELSKENCEYKHKAQRKHYKSLLIGFMKRAKISLNGVYKNKLPFEGINYEIIVKKLKEQNCCICKKPLGIKYQHYAIKLNGELLCSKECALIDAEKNYGKEEIE